MAKSSQAQLSRICFFCLFSSCCNCLWVTITTPKQELWTSTELDCFILKTHLLPGWVSSSRRKDSAEKRGRTTTEYCWRASVSCLLRSTSPRVRWDPANDSLGLRSSCSDQPIITTGFMSIRCRKESPKESLWTISLLSNTELSTWQRETHEQNTVNNSLYLWTPTSPSPTMWTRKNVVKEDSYNRFMWCKLVFFLLLLKRIFLLSCSAYFSSIYINWNFQILYTKFCFYYYFFLFKNNLK